MLNRPRKAGAVTLLLGAIAAGALVAGTSVAANAAPATATTVATHAAQAQPSGWSPCQRFICP